jgi:hypothetical protein
MTGLTEKAAETGYDVVPYTIALTNMTKAFMKAMADVPTDTPVASIGNMILQASVSRRERIVSDLQSHDKRDIDACWANAMSSRSGNDPLEDARQRVADALAGHKHNDDYFKPKSDDKPCLDHALATSSRLVVRDPEIEPCIDRTFEGTPYTSRMSGSPWPRLELPAALQRCLDPSQANTPAQQALLSFSLK